MPRKILALSAVLMIIVALSAFREATFATSTSSPMSASSPTLNFPAMQKNCAVLNVFLNGTSHPSVTCAHRHLPTKQTGAHPNTTSGLCNGSQTMEIDYTSGNNHICFYGTGYLGGFGTLNDVIEVIVYPNVSAGWYRWYNSSGGHYCTLDNTFLFPNESVSITQVDPGNTNNGVCG